MDSMSLGLTPNAKAAGSEGEIEPRPLQMPRTPVLGWASFGRSGSPVPAALDELPQRTVTTSGRAALYQALLQLKLAPGRDVLVPTYHCPTMVAPVLRAGLVPRFYGIDGQGAPLLQPADAQAGAIIAAHYFGLPRSMAVLRAWCDTHGVALIEDCAHSFFGQAGERAVGHWGDYATGSISKFFPVPEAGLLASTRRPVPALPLARRGWHAQVKGMVDVIELGARHRRFGGLNGLLDLMLRWKNGSKAATPAAGSVDPSPDADGMMAGCDMGRIGHAPLAVSRWIANALPRSRLAERRRANYARFLRAFCDAPGARPLRPTLPSHAVPYVFPLWVDDADRVYHALRRLAAPVFRWDHIWPGTPAIAGDQGPRWSRHVLQLLCHQDLRDDEVDRVVATIRHLLVSS